MKNVTILPLNEIGIYKDTDGSIYEDKIIAVLIKQDEEGFFITRPISLSDLREHWFDLNESDGFIQIKND
jgi:hypothetical protein